MPEADGEHGARPEVVIGLVGALGTDVELVQTALASALNLVRYESRPIRASRLIASQYSKLGLPEPISQLTVLDKVMEMGDTLREVNGNGAFVARLCVADISASRASETDGGDGDERDSVASVIRQLKHPHEVELLRTVYGPRFFLVGVWSASAVRRTEVIRRLKAKHPNKQTEWYEQNASRLIARDEKDGSTTFGQRVRDTFREADAYLRVVPGRSIDADVQRLVRIMFGAPFETPTRDEQSMYLAAGSSYRSSEAGRQVGVAVVDDAGEVLVTGTNDSPRAGGGQYWAGDEPDHRQFRRGFDHNDREQLMIVADLIERLQTRSGWLTRDRRRGDALVAAKEAISPGGPLEKSRIADLIEFGPILHAEMAAVCTSARRGTAIGGATMYTTTYPCHECARLIIGAGIRRLVYVDPYPKSQVPAMFEPEVTDEHDVADTVLFEPYAGIAPRLYDAFFSMSRRDRDAVDGTYLEWKAELALPRLAAEAGSLMSIQLFEDEVIKDLGVNTSVVGE